MNEPEPCAAVRGQYLPILSRRLEKLIGTDDVCLNKYSTVHDRAVDMAFGREMQHRIRLVLAKNPIQCNAIADIRVLEYIARMVSDYGERLWIRGVGQLVCVDHRDAVCDQAPARRGPNEACPSGDQYAHEPSLLSQNRWGDRGTAANPGPFPKRPPRPLRSATQCPGSHPPSERRGRDLRNRPCRLYRRLCCQVVKCKNRVQIPSGLGAGL